MHHHAVRHEPHSRPPSPPSPPRAPSPSQPPRPKPHPQQQPDKGRGVWATHIEGRYRPISVHQLAMYWSCYRAGHITFRQLRVVFALHEMVERRRYTAKTEPEGKTRTRPRNQPRYELVELSALVGGRGSPRARRALAADLRVLTQLGLVRYARHAVGFAESIEALHIQDDGFFRAMFDRLEHQQRVVPVPRRVLRAIAGGFNAATTAVVLAMLIRCVFWRKDAPGHAGSGEQGRGAYRLDGRTKREWIAQRFGITPRSVTSARARLIELGWLVPLETPQWLLNRYGAHDAINPHWNPAQSDTGISSPERDCDTKLSTPDQNNSPSPSVNLTTRTLRPTRAGPAGVSTGSTRGEGTHGRSQCVKPTMRRRGRGHSAQRASGPPSIRDIRSRDLTDTRRLLELHRQAIRLGLASDSEAGRLDFLALAERARMHGQRAGALFYYLLREKKTGFITQSAEEEASRRLKEHLRGAPERQVNRRVDVDNSGTEEARGLEPLSTSEQEKRDEHGISEDERIVAACLRVAKSNRIGDPYTLAWQAKGWSREKWETALDAFNAMQFEQMRTSQGFVE